MAATQQRFLQPEVVAQLATMELRAATVVEGVMSGLHRSPFHGLSIEFAEYRRYQPGDDPKKVDWKAYARSDRYYIKQFEDETNLDAWIVLDASASMNFGSRGLTKWQYAGILAASLAYLLHQQNDAAGLVVLNDVIQTELPSKNTRAHLVQLIGQLESVQPSRETRLAEILHQVASRVKRRGMVILISDLLDEPEEVVAALRHLKFGGNDIVVFQTLDTLELGFDFNGPHHFIDPETNAMVPALAEEVRESYLAAMERFTNQYREALGRVNMSYTLLNTAEPLDRALLSFLGQNGRAG